MKICKNKKSTHTILGAEAWGPVIITKPADVIKISREEASEYTIEDALELYSTGTAVVLK